MSGDSSGARPDPAPRRAVAGARDLDRDARTMIGDLLADLGVSDHSRIDRWLASTDAVLEDGASGSKG
jgi:hypothetical protein